MRRPNLIALAGLLSAAVSYGGPVETAIVAAMQLPDAPNYSWRTDVADDAKTYEIVGATDRASNLSLATMPLASAAPRRSSRAGGTRASASGTSIATVVFEGSEKYVVQAEDGWKKPEDLAATGERGDPRRGGYGGPPGVGGFPGGGGPRARGSRGRGPGGGEGGPETSYSNLQNTLSRPHEEIAIIVAGASDLKVSDDVVTGTLSETAAALLLVHAGQKNITPRRATGTVRLWVKNGALQKYETHLQGTLAVEGRDGRREVTVNQTATTTLSEVGTTKLEVPEEAKKKLGG